ncbi:shikimate kinase, chloroplastic-like [Humulus lupulus]|uniref:shikimate kinase, chloroplastic-like n=1 Tax=Humulus lupulus TaxID=3486 RepID=UPI002B406731|nr:shikimate kinase, chloroplastic-like [Humulus lupulus]
MEAVVPQTVQFTNWISSEKVTRRPGWSFPVSQTLKDRQKFPVLVSARFPANGASNRRRNVDMEVWCSYKSSPGSVVESGNYQAPFDEAQQLKIKSEKVKPCLMGRCIYLVGMMGSGKTTVGKILSQELGYAFRDCDTLIEEEAELSVAEIFKLKDGESQFRRKEMEVLQELSCEHSKVVSTGGGAVVRNVNWKYMQKGITVWLDVPLDALAQRTSADGTSSRPLLPNKSGDIYSETFMCLSNLLQQRRKLYAKANARVSLEDIVAKLGQTDVSNLTATTIAIEALEQIEVFLKKEVEDFLKKKKEHDEFLKRIVLTCVIFYCVQLFFFCSCLAFFF